VPPLRRKDDPLNLRRLRNWSWPESYPIAQFPNPPLVVGLVALGLRAVAPEDWANVLGAIGYVFIGVWAYLELTAGVNLFRRILGAAGIAYGLQVRHEFHERQPFPEAAGQPPAPHGQAAGGFVAAGEAAARFRTRAGDE
jgi:hypothetical protein